MKHRASNGYRSIQAAGSIEGATPHRLTALLFEAALASIQTARHTTDVAARRTSIDKALAIVGELQGSLRDPETDALAGQLHSLYGFVLSRLLDANRLGDDTTLSQAHDTLLPLHEAWQGIGPTGSDLAATLIRTAGRGAQPLQASARG